MTAEPFLQAAELQMQFPGGVLALQDVNLGVDGGEFVSIVGPSGCGKSTLLRLVAGLLEPTGGSLTVDGLPAKTARREKHQVAFVFQDANLLPWRNVRKNVQLPLEITPPKERDSGKDLSRSLELVGLTDFARTYPHQLSGGMRMRVSLARALVTRPGLMLMDEPFGALDEITRQRLNEEVLRLWASEKWTCLFVTHNVFEAVFLSRRVAVMSARPGSIVGEVGVPFEYPRTPELREQPEFAVVCGEVSRLLRTET
jgi:NitT/TauT family transport system ATP-binding protein